MKEEVHAPIKGKSMPGGLIESAKTLRRESALSVLRIARCGRPEQEEQGG